MIVLDTTILVYAVGEDHPLRSPCRRLLAAHANGEVDITTTVEVVQEFAHVRARRRPRTDAIEIVRHFASAFTLMVAQPGDLALGLDLWSTNEALGAFDSVLAAVALNRRAEAFVSADRAFAAVPQLPWIDPATPDFERLFRT
ncbi:MAG: type II toxin-antitoxin system VapC family toxin [Thermoleophilia bacterium]